MSFSMKAAVIVLFISFFTCIGAIVLYQYGPEAWQGTETLYDLHRFSGMIMTLPVIWHIVLNRKWLKNAFKGGKK